MATTILLDAEHPIPKARPAWFELLSRVASSPTGAVFCARVLRAAHPAAPPCALVALKTRLAPELGRAADVLHEARVNIAHPRIVRCLGAYFGELPPPAPRPAPRDPCNSCRAAP